MSVDIAGRAHPGQHRGRYAEPFQDLLIPAESVNVKKHGPGSIGIVCHMDRPPGEVPDQPGVHSAEEKFPGLGPLPGPRHILQDPGDLGSAEISVRHQSRFPGDHLVKSVLFQLLDHVRCPAALPYNGIVHRLPGILVPEDGGLPLVGNSYGGNLFRSRPQHCHALCGHSQLGGPYLPGIVLHPAGPGVNLSEFLLRHGADIPCSVK